MKCPVQQAVKTLYGSSRVAPAGLAQVAEYRPGAFGGMEPNNAAARRQVAESRKRQ